MKDKILGYCKECGTAIKKSHSLKEAGHPHVYECPTCSYPSDTNDLWDELSSDLIEYRKKNGLNIEY